VPAVGLLWVGFRRVDLVYKLEESPSGSAPLIPLINSNMNHTLKRTHDHHFLVYYLFVYYESMKRKLI
jgi:hypothetical protein